MADIIRSIDFKAPIETVWAFLTEPEKIGQWLMPNTFRPVLGHHFVMDCPPGVGSGAPIQSTVTELAPPANRRARLAYTWFIDQPPLETLLEIDLSEAGGVTRLDLVHSGWDSLSAEDLHIRARHEGGWDYLLGTLLKGLVEG